MVEQDRAQGGLFSPDSAKEKPLEAVVAAVGNGRVQTLAITAGDHLALQSAASVASLMLTTEALIAERPEHGTTTSDQENS